MNAASGLGPLVYPGWHMVDERRTSPRVRISGVRVIYESGSGERVDAFALDLGAGGLFVRTAAPLAVGKRIALEIQVVGEALPWSALGRVVWSRDKGEGEKAPPGMGVKLIDADDAVLAAIARLVEMRERTEPGVGRGSTPPRSSPPEVFVAPPEHERTPLGVGTSSDEAPATPRVLVDVVGDRAARRRTSPAPPPPAPVEKGGGAGRTLALLVLIVVAGVAAYVLLDAFRHHWHPLGESLSLSAWAEV